MIHCEHCESARFLDITFSRTQPSDDGSRIVSIYEEHTCRNCTLEGTAMFDLENDTVELEGGIVRTPERPLTAPKRVGGDA